MEFAAHGTAETETGRHKEVRGPPPPRKIPSAKHVKDELQVTSVAKPPTELPGNGPSALDGGSNYGTPLPSAHPEKLSREKSGRQNDWFSINDKKRRNSANMGRALLSSGLLDKDTSRKMSIVGLLRKNSTETNVQKAASKWKKMASLKQNGYVVSRSPSGDTIQVNHSLMNNSGFYELKNDCSFERALPDSDDWIAILSHHARERSMFVDPKFPPENRSLFQDGKRTKKNSYLGKIVKSWRRISDIFHQKYILHLKFTESERVPECFGYETGAKNLPPLIQREALSANAANSIKMAKLLVDSVLSEADVTRRTDAVLQYGGPMGQSLLEKNIFQTIAEQHLPMQYTHVSDDETYIVDRQVRSGYTTMVKVQVTICFDPPRGVHLFDIHEDGNMVGTSDVCQGQLGDCYLMGALSVISRIPRQAMNLFPSCKQDVLRNHEHQPPQEYNKAGVYAIRFWRGNAWRIVVVDDYIPCGKDGLPCFANLSEGSCEFWPLIVEKAYAKLNGSYEAIISGKENQALQDFTGGVPISIQIGNKIKEEYAGEKGQRKLWEYLNCRIDEGSHIGVSKSKEGLSGRSLDIEENHAYGILKLSMLNGQTPLVKVRNPWGKGREWCGAFSDSDPIWESLSPVAKQELGYTKDVDGSWWMTFQDMLYEFDELSVCRMMDNFQVHHVVGHWKGVTASGRDAPHLSPQYHLHLSEGEGKAHVVVEVRQPSHRDVGGNVYQGIKAFVAGNADRHGNVYLEPRLDDNAFVSSRSAVIEIDCSRTHSPISISPVTWDSAYESVFYVDIYTNCKSNLIACNDHDLPRDPVSGEILKGSIISYKEDDGRKVFLLKKNQKKYLKATADICVHCKKPIIPGGTFSGKYIQLEGGENVHSECWQKFKTKNADRCLFCKKPVVQVKGKFSGAFFSINESGVEGKVHEECMDRYKQKTAPKCLYCRMPVCKIEGKFSGAFYTIDEQDGGKVHEECYSKYQSKKAPKCFKCKMPIVAGGLFSGSYYDIEKKGKIHKECYSP